MKYLLGLMISILLAMPANALACADPQESPFVHELARAKNVFIFRLLSLRLSDRSPGARSIVGDVQIIRSLKGDAATRQISFTNLPCGGMRPVVGHYYAAATRQSGPTLLLVRGDNSIIDVTSDYAMTIPPPPEESKWQWHIANYIDGVPLPPHFVRSSAYLSAYGTPPPPETQ